ncbi:unnamed protein product [Clonostachys byssicola]|uniref:Uncharacterized protein n=1 Tax=Clonostachys byssicola TaxID=160290 RepID=A0A9N9U812_9HYPO|nr:unnamed protein product [Clonostachys byssicola]
MSEPHPKTGDCSPEPNEASALENDLVASCKALDLDCQPDNKSNNGSMDHSEEEPSKDSEEESSDGSDWSVDSSLELEFDASRPNVLGSPQGQCERCKKREASVLCFFCGTGSFCSPWCCEMSHEKGKHMCVPTEDTTAKKLLLAVGQDLPPNDPQTLDDYYLTPLTAPNRHEDLEMLLGIYRNLLTGFHISSPQLHQWKEAKQIFNNIVRLHNRYPTRAPAIQSFWLKNHGHVFLEEDKSEVLDFDAYLRANDTTFEQFIASLLCYM